jgi:hypothetical protein
MLKHWGVAYEDAIVKESQPYGFGCNGYKGAFMPQF